MLRLVVLLLIASLLACPLRCQAHEVASSAGSGTAGCACCGDRQTVPDAPASNAPVEGCGCSDCLCHGAVLGGGTDILAALLLYLAAAVSVAVDDLGLQPAVLGSATDALRYVGMHATGRAVRIAHRSLLI